jgi:hypothetical protein
MAASDQERVTDQPLSPAIVVDQEALASVQGTVEPLAGTRRAYPGRGKSGGSDGLVESVGSHAAAVLGIRTKALGQVVKVGLHR